MGYILAPIKNQLAVPIDKFLYQKLLNIKIIQKAGWDCAFLVTGDERSGKSTLAIGCGWILSQGKLTVDNIASDTTDAISKLENLPEESVLIIDEGSLMFSSKDTMRREQRQLIKILNIIGQKRMILIICLPDFFDLAKYIVHRARFLIRTYADKNLNRGRFMYWGSKRKNILYEVGKKHFNSYAYPKSNFKSRFKDFNPLGEAYLKAKEKSLWAALKGDKRISNMENKHIRQRDVFIRYLYKEVRMKQSDIAKLLPKGLLEITASEVSRICSKSEESVPTNSQKL